VNKPPGRSPGGLIQQLPANGRFRCIPTLKIEPIWLTKSKPAWLDVRLNQLVAADAL
jgi:hypothetical protein